MKTHFGSKLKLGQLYRKMSVFTNTLNLVTGQQEWIIQCKNYDYKQEISRSSYADMLHDSERNEKYYNGLKAAVSILRRQNKKVHVLDIGTGTGLLSMMAVKCQVDSVTACEAFAPMARCARDILTLNNCGDKVKLIEKRSTDLECGPTKDMAQRANLLITEVFDTELIGEGAIESFLHAKENLLTDDAIIVPSEATVYAQVISSNLVKNWNKINPIMNPKEEKQCLVSVPAAISKCGGSAAVYDMQLSEVQMSDFQPISQPIPVFKFDWSGRKIPLDKNRKSLEEFVALKNGSCDAIFMWWDLKMDPCGEVILSCAPVWDHPLTKGKPNPKSSEIPWRDHWMQAIYYLPKELRVKENENLVLNSFHDEYSLWFDLFSKGSPDADILRPVCECGLHGTTSRTRIGAINDSRRRELYMRILEKNIQEYSNVLILGNSCFMWAVAAAKLGAKSVYVLKESLKMSDHVLQNFVSHNDVQNKVHVVDVENFKPAHFKNLIDLVFCEPYFDTSLLPWHSVQYMYKMRQLKPVLSEHVKIYPEKMSLWGLPVQFRDLWKIRAPLSTCCGFRMDIFDKFIESSCNQTDERVEPQPLWEYPCEPLGLPVPLLNLESQEVFGLDEDAMQENKEVFRPDENAMQENKENCLESFVCSENVHNLNTERLIDFENENENSENATISGSLSDPALEISNNLPNNSVFTNLKSGVFPKTCDDTLKILKQGTLNGIVIWADWHFGTDTLGTGPISDVSVGEMIDWDKYTRQGVYLMNGVAVQENFEIKSTASFCSKNGKFSFDFSFPEN